MVSWLPGFIPVLKQKHHGGRYRGRKLLILSQKPGIPASLQAEAGGWIISLRPAWATQ
jgi:hypothetical protein